ncbi:MAG: hypothetical protein M3R17_10890 [Bacteroidota bacterium]|nr:hypothetical protein [Bacteroidota bacterium]
MSKTVFFKLLKLVYQFNININVEILFYLGFKETALKRIRKISSALFLNLFTTFAPPKECSRGTKQEEFYAKDENQLQREEEIQDHWVG